jgi:hypothetical protein
MWPIVCPPTSTTVASHAPILTTSPAITVRSTSAILGASTTGAITSQPVLALIPALPPAWSGCQCVFQIAVIGQPLASASRKYAPASGVSMHTVSPLSGSCSK